MTSAAFIDGKLREHKQELCGDQECCGECDVTAHYGFYGGYGLGGMELCMRCGAISNFTEDRDQ